MSDSQIEWERIGGNRWRVTVERLNYQEAVNAAYWAQIANQQQQAANAQTALGYGHGLNVCPCCGAPHQVHQGPLFSAILGI